MFHAGDTVVYPQHGAGHILGIVEHDFRGARRPYFLIEILHNHMTVMVPVDGAEKVGLRDVLSPEMLEQVLGVLRGDPTKMPVNWSQRVRQNRDKIKTGDIMEIADVLRNLAQRDHQRGLSTGEKQMYIKLRRIVASEFMCARNMCEDEALRYLDGVLSEAREHQSYADGR